MLSQSLVAGRSSQFLILKRRLRVLVLCAIRVYALYNKNYYVLVGLFALILATIVVGIVRISTTSSSVPIVSDHR